MSAPSTAMSALSAALLTTTPACQGDDRFIADDQDADELAHICAACPMYTICATYARTARPPAGIWAGRRYNKPLRKESDHG